MGDIELEATIVTNNAEETMALGKRLGEKLTAGDVLALFGDLGAGKTTLTKGIAEGMQLAADVHSPTFTLIHEHPGPVPLYHIDLYRLSGEEEVESLGLEEYIYGDGVTIIEWADRMLPELPGERLDITLRMKGDTRREFVFSAQSDRMTAIIEELIKEC